MGSYLRGTAVIAARATAVVLAIVLAPLAAAGWLYWVRARVVGWPGPRVADALPLDELPGHDSVPLIVCVAAFAASGLMLGLAARAVRLDRLTAAWALAAGTGIWLLAIDAVSLFVVRQVPAAQALRAAAGLQPVYIAAALAGAGGALLGRRGHRGSVAPRLLAWLVAAAGAIDLVSALFPDLSSALGSLARFAPGAAGPAAHTLVVPAGVLLVLASRGLLRRNRRAWRLAVALLSLSVLLQLLRGPDYAGAIVAGLTTMALLARRDDFAYHGDPSAEPSALLRLSGMLLAALLYGVTALTIYRTAFGLPFSPAAALLGTLRAMGGQLPSDVDLLPTEFAEWFPLSVLSIVAIGVIWAAAVWIRPWRQRMFRDTDRRGQATEIVRRWGADTLAPFALRSDKEWFVTGGTLIAYRVVRGVALISGDPIGPPGETEPALRAFLAHAREHGWRVAVLGAAGQSLGIYQDLGLRPLYHGDEAVIDVQEFSLEGRRMRTARQATHRLERTGYHAEVLMAGDVPTALHAELVTVDRAWLRDGARKGFAMELDGLFRLGGSDAAFVIGRDPNGGMAGFLHLVVCPASRSLSLSTMPRLRDTPNGFTAWLITETAFWARDHGYAHLSLNFSPFAGLLGPETGLQSAQRLQRRVLLRLKDVMDLQLDNLLRFNGQFAPAWIPRYVIVQAWADLPRVAVAAMAAEGYLPYAALIRGRGWAPASEHEDRPEPDARQAAAAAPQKNP